MFDIHAISCCALRVDSTCCCLALHTIWNPFTYFCVTCLPSSAAVEPYVSPCAKSSSMCALWAAEGKHWNALKGFQRHLFKIRCVLFLMLWGGGDESSYPLYIYIYLLRSLTLAASCFSICNHFSHRWNVITACLEKKQTIEELFSLHWNVTFSVKELIVVESGNWSVIV